MKFEALHRAIPALMTSSSTASSLPRSAATFRTTATSSPMNSPAISMNAATEPRAAANPPTRLAPLACEIEDNSFDSSTPSRAPNRTASLSSLIWAANSALLISLTVGRHRAPRRARSGRHSWPAPAGPGRRRRRTRRRTASRARGRRKPAAQRLTGGGSAVEDFGEFLPGNAQGLAEVQSAQRAAEIGGDVPNTGLHRSTTSSSPPTMTSSLPSSTAGAPPLTGASVTETPCAAAFSAISRQVSGCTVL